MDSTWWRSADDIDDDQKTILSLPTEGNYLITGPPGSGKTNLIVLRGVYLRAAGFPNCQILVFTRTLTEFIASGAGSGAKFPPERISTHAKWTYQLIRSLGGEYEDSDEDEGHDIQRANRHNALEDAINGAGVSQDYYESILLDEVQDYWECEIQLMARITRRLFVVGDARQRIYDRNEGIAAALDGGCKEHRLKFHYRLGRAICRAADKVLPDPDGIPLEQYCQYREAELPSTVERHEMPNEQAQCERMIEKLKLQLRAYPGEWIGVVVPRRAIRDNIVDFLSESELSDKFKAQVENSKDRTFDPSRPICVMVAQSSKGTEFRAVHLIAADKFKPYFSRELMFTIITRAKTSLDVYHSGVLDGSLEAALAERRVPDIEELFD